METETTKRRRGRPRKPKAEAGPYREAPPQEPAEVCTRVYALVRRREGDTTGWSLVEAHGVPMSAIEEHAVEVGPVRDLATTIAVIEKRLQQIAYSGV